MDKIRKATRNDWLDDEPTSTRVAAALRQEEMRGLRLATWGRVISLAAIAVLIYGLVPPHSRLYYEFLLAIFVAIGFAHYRLSIRPGASWWLAYLFVALDFALLSYTLFAPIPFAPEQLPPQITLRFRQEVYYFLLIAAAAFTFRPRIMLWAGFTAALGWSAGHVWLLSLPSTIWQETRHNPINEQIALLLHPHFVDLGAWLQGVVLMLLVAGLLALVVARSRRLVLRQASVERERANLSRYFPPTIVDRLAHLDHPLGAVRTQPVTVMFADIVGFTKMAEHLDAEAVIATLRGFHTRMERAVFDHRGTLDKFLGDGLMATFGTPESGPRDALNALACTQAMIAAIDDWNVSRVREGDAPIRLSIGLHHGRAMLGDIGSARRLEFAVVGDVVNVASRLERLTREQGCQVVVSDEVAKAARAEDAMAAARLLAGFVEGPRQRLRGRDEAVRIWTLAPLHAISPTKNAPMSGEPGQP